MDLTPRSSAPQLAPLVTTRQATESRRSYLMGRLAPAFLSDPFSRSTQRLAPFDFRLPSIRLSLCTHAKESLTQDQDPGAARKVFFLSSCASPHTLNLLQSAAFISVWNGYRALRWWPNSPRKCRELEQRAGCGLQTPAFLYAFQTPDRAVSCVRVSHEIQALLHFWLGATTSCEVLVHGTSHRLLFWPWSCTLRQFGRQRGRQWKYEQDGAQIILLSPLISLCKFAQRSSMTCMIWGTNAHDCQGQKL